MLQSPLLPPRRGDQTHHDGVVRFEPEEREAESGAAENEVNRPSSEGVLR
jgi:hypothetical protein